jgi:hypothetical protein
MEHINTYIGKTEQVNFMFDLQNNLDTSVNYMIQPGRILIKEGLVTYYEKKNIASKPKKKHIILFNDILVLCKSEDSLNVDCILPLADCTLHYCFDNKLLSITHADKIFSIFTRDGDWADSIQNAIDKVFIILIYYNKQS